MKSIVDLRFNRTFCLTNRHYFAILLLKEDGNMYLKRDIEEYILKASQFFQAIVLYGPRQVGKSTTIEMLFGKTFHIVTLDDLEERMLAINNPKGFLEVHPWPLIIDEVQKAPGLLSEIKIVIDEQRKKWLDGNESRQLMYVLTGSNQFELQSAITESLAGRACVLNMYSMTQMEASGHKGFPFNPNIQELIKIEQQAKVKYQTKAQIFETIFRGGMPDVVVANSERELYYKSYIDTYIEKDISNLINIAYEAQFRRFLSYLALRTAQQINYEVMARELGITVVTIKRWISILITSGIVVLLEPYMANLSNRIIKSSKLYFMDTGLCAYLCKWPNAKMLEACAMAGAFFETFVVSEIIKGFCNYNIDRKSYLYYYRDIDQKEIDLLYVDNNAIYPIEIKKGEMPIKANKNFNILTKYNMEIKPGIIIDTCDKIRPINDKAYYFPVYLLGL